MAISKGYEARNGSSQVVGIKELVTWFFKMAKSGPKPPTSAPDIGHLAGLNWRNHSTRPVTVIGRESAVDQPAGMDWFPMSTMAGESAAEGKGHADRSRRVPFFFLFE